MALLMIMLLALLLAADEAPLDCASPQTQVAMNECAVRDYVRADDAMNAQWRVTLNEMHRRDHDIDLPGTSGELSYSAALLSAQRAWLAYRDAECRVQGYAAMGGSMRPMLVSLCLTQLTEQRTAQLRATLEE